MPSNKAEFTAAPASANVAEAIDIFVKNVQAFLDAHYAAGFPNGYPSSPRIDTMAGPRYVRLVAVDRMKGEATGGRSAWGFIDRTSGDVLKAAGWKAPAKGPRGSVFALTFEGYGVTEHGPRYL